MDCIVHGVARSRTRLSMSGQDILFQDKDLETWKGWVQTKARWIAVGRLILESWSPAMLGSQSVHFIYGFAI